MSIARLIVFCVLLLQGIAFAGDELTLSPAYLQGLWSLDGKAGCDSGNAGYVLFRDNGTLEVGRGGQVQRVGFWKIVNASIVANTLTAPAVQQESHPFFGDSYRYEYVAPEVLKTEQDAFSVSIGSDLEKEKRQVQLTRCP